MSKEEVQTEDSDLDVGYSLLDIGHSCLWVVGTARVGSDLRPRASVRASRSYGFLDAALRTPGPGSFPLDISAFFQDVSSLGGEQAIRIVKKRKMR